MVHFIALMSGFLIPCDGHKTGAASEFPSVSEKAVAETPQVCLEGLQEPQDSTEVRESRPLPGARGLLEKATHRGIPSPTFTESLKCSTTYGEFFILKTLSLHDTHPYYMSKTAK